MTRRSQHGEMQTLKFVCYYGMERFLLAAPSFTLDRSGTPYRRLSATLLVACKEPFHLEVADDCRYTGNVALIAPDTPRHRTVAENSDILIFDVSIGSPECTALRPILRDRQLVTFELAQLHAWLPTMQKALDCTASAEEVRRLFSGVIGDIAGNAPGERHIDSRIEAALRLIHELPFNEVNLQVLASRLHLSPSRLRHLFKDEIGSTLSRYLRWVAVWRGVDLWAQGKPLTEIAHEAGFYDLAHLNRAYVELFGINPSSAVHPRNVTVIRSL